VGETVGGYRGKIRSILRQDAHKSNVMAFTCFHCKGLGLDWPPLMVGQSKERGHSLCHIGGAANTHNSCVNACNMMEQGLIRCYECQSRYVSKMWCSCADLYTLVHGQSPCHAAAGVDIIVCDFKGPEMTHLKLGLSPRCGAHAQICTP
jgi:hypothetical protein